MPPRKDPPDPPSIIPIWGCESCALLFKSYKRGLEHCRNSPAHAAQLASARDAGGAIGADKAIESMLTWYKRIADSELTDVKAAVGAAQIVSDAIISGQNNTELRRALRKAMETPRKETTVATPPLPPPAAEKKKRRRHRSPTPAPPLVRASMTPPPTIIAVFRVRLQSLEQFTTATSPARFPQGVESHYFQYLMTDDAAKSVAVMVAALRLQFLNTSQVNINWWDLINTRWVLRATAIGRDIAELTIGSEEDFPAVLPWVMARGDGWNWLMEIG